MIVIPDCLFQFYRSKSWSIRSCSRKRIMRWGFPWVLAFCICLFTSGFSYAENRLAEQRNVIFDRMGTEDGLSQDGVYAITQDSQGYIWIGTEEGLNQYHGYGFETYYHLEEDAASLSHDNIWTLL